MNLVMYLKEYGASKALSPCRSKMMQIYHAPTRCVADTIQEPFYKELERILEHQILAPLGVNEMAEWYSSFIIVLNQALIRPIHRDLVPNYILPKVTNMHYLTIIDVSLGHHNWKLD